MPRRTPIRAIAQKPASHTAKNPEARPPLLRTLLGVLSICLPFSAGRAAELYTADGITLRWDNTLRYSSAVRISSQNSTLLADVNADDGDRNFAAGLVSNRLDLTSQLDITLDDFGLHVGADGWYDTVYHSRTDNHSAATYNAAPVPSTRFAPAVRDLHGQYAELDDAFLYGGVSFADIPLSVRIGRQTVLWGESLFYDANSIASAQAPTDYTRTVTGQSSYANNVYLPVTQLSLTAQLFSDIAVTVYDQFEARPSRQAGDGSYFSYVDFLGPGAQRLFLPSGQLLIHRDDGKASAAGQYGVALRGSLDDLDIGIYALRYNATDPEIVTAPDPDASDPGTAGYYRLVYPKGITLFGASASMSLNDSTIAAELSMRQNMPLLAYPPGKVMPGDASTRYGRYFRGDLLHAQTSAQVSMGRSNAWDSADLSAELAGDAVTDVNDSAIASSLDRYAAKARFLFEPHYFQVIPNLDLTFPIGVGYNLTGHSFTYYAQNGGAGDFEVGVSALYRSAWKASLTMTGFIGSPTRQPLADRDIIAVSLERTF